MNRRWCCRLSATVFGTSPSFICLPCLISAKQSIDNVCPSDSASGSLNLPHKSSSSSCPVFGQKWHAHTREAVCYMYIALQISDAHTSSRMATSGDQPFESWSPAAVSFSYHSALAFGGSELRKANRITSLPCDHPIGRPATALHTTKPRGGASSPQPCSVVF